MNRLSAFPALLLGLMAVALSGCGGGNALDVVSGWQSGVCGLIYAIVIVWAFVQIANSRADTGSKILWALVVFFFPFVGLIAWYFMGPGRR